jgi:hypothetical protein
VGGAWFALEMGWKLGLIHDKTNGRWEGQGSLRHDKLGDMGHLVPMRKEA